MQIDHAAIHNTDDLEMQHDLQTQWRQVLSDQHCRNSHLQWLNRNDLHFSRVLQTVRSVGVPSDAIDSGMLCLMAHLVQTLQNEYDVFRQGAITDRNKSAATISRLEKELDYYKSAAQRKTPRFVPKAVTLLKDVRGDVPGNDLIAYAGVHDCSCNRHGAVSVTAANGQMLGVRLDEFEVIQWRENDK